MQREFVYTSQFEKSWQKLGFTDNDLFDLETELLRNPQIGDVVPETGGLRKFRVPAKGHGKRGGARVAYVDFVFAEKIYLIAAYAKNEKVDLSKDETKQISKMILSLTRDLKKGRKQK